MTWAPCFLASCVAATCFWIIDSLSPVQLACSSAPRTILGISSPLALGLTSEACPVKGESVHRATRGGRPSEARHGHEAELLLRALHRELAALADATDVPLVVEDVRLERRPLLGEECALVRPGGDRDRGGEVQHLEVV